ncbi:MAG: ThuA domain-containing protein [Kiritimatiellaeota bacterium]|nr:ThuA domain-containing protein [Kiritimatiellota bacterium]
MKKILLFGGGGVHDHKGCCDVLSGHLRQLDVQFDRLAEDYDAFTEERIKEYDVLVLYHTGGELAVEQKRGLVEWCAAGGKILGVHGATDSFKTSPEYLAMIGGVLKAHPFFRKYIVGLNDGTHPAVAGIEGYSVKDWEKWPVFEFEVEDEQYLLDYDSRNTILASTLFRGRLWPVAWTNRWGKGSVFYLALGHNPATCENPFFRKIFASGLEWLRAGAPEPDPKENKFAIS